MTLALNGLYRWPRWPAVVLPFLVSRCTAAATAYEQLSWSAVPSTTGSTFSTQSEAVADFQSYGGIYALMTEALPPVQQDDRLLINYKIPDEPLFIGEWLYEHEWRAATFLSEQAVFDDLLQTLIDRRKSSIYTCPPYVEIDAPGSVPWESASTSSNMTAIATYGIAASEDKWLPTRYYDVKTDGSCYGDPAGTQRLLRRRDLHCSQYLTYSKTLELCTNGYRATVTGASNYYLTVPELGPNNECEGNPCNPSTGNKSQTETDLASSSLGALAYKRFYNSLGEHNSSPAISPGWRHSFDRRLNESVLGRPADDPRKIRQSALYATPSEACQTGWNDIKDSAWGGVFAGATATAMGTQNCRISLAGKTVAVFPIRPTLTFFVPTPPPNPNNSRPIVLSRPDGEIYHFEYQDGIVWKAMFHPELRLERTTTAWVFTDADGTREEYDDAGKLISITSLHSDVQSLTYDSNDRLEKVENNVGGFLLFAYDTADRISAVTDQAGRTWSYRYDSAGRLAFVDRPDGSSRQYHYEDPNFTFALTGITDERGIRYATWAYNADGKAVLSEHAGGADHVALAYNVDGTTTVTTGGGATRVYRFVVVKGARSVTQVTGDLCPTCPNGEKAARRYDDAGNMDQYADWSGSVTRLGGFDSKGQAACKTVGIDGNDAADTSGDRCAFDPVVSPNARRTDFVFDPRFYQKVVTSTEDSVYRP